MFLFGQILKMVMKLSHTDVVQAINKIIYCFMLSKQHFEVLELVH